MIEVEKFETTSPSITNEQIERLKSIFPDVFTEGKIDFDKLKASLGNIVDNRTEKYSFTWAGKKKAIQLLQTPSQATLIPVEEESINFESTQNLFIEGDNLEVLKLLYKSYSGQVKMIYIDPPYNTGNDFVYPDNFVDPLETYLEVTGQKDAAGNLLTSNPETSGRYHSSWLSMIYPRLYLARQFLRDDGVIFVSIDDHEVYNLRLLMNEIFGEENFIAELVWEKTRKNDAKLFSVGHEYMLVYARSLSFLKDIKTIWREEKPGARQIIDQYRILRFQLGNDDKAIEKALQNWYRSLQEGHPSKKLSRYKHIDKNGPWRDSDISWPGGGGPRYEVIHPVTNQACEIPERGWRYASLETMQKQIQLGLVEFREDHTEPPIRKAHLIPVLEELEDELLSTEHSDEDNDNDDEQIGLQVMPSVLYRQSQVAVKYLRKLMGGKAFDNPKDHEIIARLIKYCTSVRNGDIVLDFFAGACTTAEAVLRLNHEDDGNRHFICVQLPEPTSEKSSARKLGFLNIAEIGKERIRRVISTLGSDEDGKLDLSLRKEPEDLGFRVFKLASSNFRKWHGVDGEDAEAYAAQLALFTDPLIEGWLPENILWELVIKEGYGLNTRTKKLEEIRSNTVWKLTDPEKDQSLFVCLDNRLEPSTLTTLSLSRDQVFVCLNKALDDTIAANLALQCRLKKI